MRPLAAFYLLIFAAVGSSMPWLPPLLASRGFSAAMIGVALAVGALTRVALPPLYGKWADRAPAARPLLVVAASLTGVFAALLSVVSSVWGIYLILFGLGAASVPLIPLAETLTLRRLGEHGTSYGQIRLWGSVGFIIAAIGGGYMVQRFGLRTVPWLIAVPYVAAAFVARILPPTTGAPARSSVVTERELHLRALIPLYLAAGLGQGSHGPYYAFFTLQMEQRGLSSPATGALWSLGVVAEIALMAGAPRLLAPASLMTALRMALVLSTVRWSLMAAAPGWSVIAVGQLLHAASFALLHITAVQLVGERAPLGSAHRAQAWLSVATGGIGTGLGILLAGQFAESWGARGLYLGAATLSTLACIVTGFDRRRRSV